MTSHPRESKRWPLHTRIFLGLALGTAAGVSLNRVFGGEHPAVNWLLSNVTEPVGQFFLRVLLMTVIPLVFSSLVVGVAGLGDLRKLGRIGLKSFVYCAVISAISVLIGLGLVNTIQPGKRIDSSHRGRVAGTLWRGCAEEGRGSEEGRHDRLGGDAGDQDACPGQSRRGRSQRDAEYASPDVFRGGLWRGPHAGWPGATAGLWCRYWRRFTRCPRKSST